MIFHSGLLSKGPEESADGDHDHHLRHHHRHNIHHYHWLWSPGQVGTVSHPKVQTLSNRTPDAQPAIAMEGGAADRNHSGEGQGGTHTTGNHGGGGDTMGWGAEGGPSSAAPYMHGTFNSTASPSSGIANATIARTPPMLRLKRSCATERAQRVLIMPPSAQSRDHHFEPPQPYSNRSHGHAFVRPPDCCTLSTWSDPWLRFLTIQCAMTCHGSGRVAVACFDTKHDEPAERAALPS